MTAKNQNVSQIIPVTGRPPLSPVPVDATSKRPRARPAAKTTVIAQIRFALKRSNRLTAFVGCVFGGFIPFACFCEAHRELQLDSSVPFYQQPAFYIVLGGLAFSARTVAQWGFKAFRDRYKTFGYVVLMEGVMVSSRLAWLSIPALVCLIAINGIATACNLTQDPKSPDA